MERIGRRHQKKLETMESVVLAADALFAEQGYDDTKVEDISSSAGVSPGTVYNYFGTKGAILAAVAGRQFENALAGAMNALDLDTQDPVDALMPVLRIYLDGMTAFDKDLLKEIFRAGFDPAASDVLSALVSLDKLAIEQIGSALDRMRGAGRVTPSADPMEAATLVYSILATAMIWFVSVPDMKRVEVEEFVHKQLMLAFDGLRVR